MKKLADSRAQQKPAYFAEEKPSMAADISSSQPLSPRHPLTSQPNGAYKASRTDMLNGQRQHYEEDHGYLVPNQVNELQRKASDMTNGSDPDSVLDYYNPDGKNGVRNTSSQQSLSKEKGKKRKAAGSNWNDLEKDDSNWIHRDKLKEIESRELEQFGYQVGRASRSNSRSHSAVQSSRDRKNSELTEPSQSGDDHQDPRRIPFSIPTEHEEVEEDEDSPANWDLRTPEEIAAEKEWSLTPQANHVIRPSTSRIPIAKTSPLPVPHTFVERDVPLPRSRKGSGNWTGDAIAVNGARVRSGSISSQFLLDEPRPSGELLRTPVQPNFSHPTSPTNGSPPRSPPKAKTPGKPTPTSGKRAVSAQKPTSATKPRVTSATSPVKRPGTSGGSISRPSTSHRPEGEAPWIATMYKPDPRLPPDQQIIPTHAKRMQQDQWESEGKHGSMYDRDFRLLNTDDFKDKRASQIQLSDLESQQFKQEDDPQWPLPSPTKPTPERIDTNVKSPTSEQGGYKLTPTIPQSPRVPSRTEPRPAPMTSPKPTNTTRLPEPPAGEEKQKKGCCCIVM